MIPLTQGKFTVVDDKDFGELSKYKWCAHKGHNTYYACRSISTNGKATLIRMHQQLLGKKEGLEIDHVDGDGLNNQCHNLRHVTRRQNMQNIHGVKSSKYSGVTWQKNRKKWLARIEINGTRKYLGLYSDEHEASLAYRNAEMSLAYSHTNNLPDCRNENMPRT